MSRFAAVDLGASSGRIMVASVGGRANSGGAAGHSGGAAGHSGGPQLELVELNRFRNGPVPVGGRLFWDVLGLWQDLLTGLSRAGEISGIGIDTWGVDYGLLDAQGALLANPRHYRDDRTIGMPERIDGVLPPDELYRLTGVQRLTINTIYQLAAESDSGVLLPQASSLLLMPDLLGYWLTGRRITEMTIASTTGLLDATTRDWSAPALAAAGVDPGLLAPIRPAGSAIGPLTPAVAAATGLSERVLWTAVGSHDTASAVAAVPARDAEFAYIACGTWGLVGIELDSPVLTEHSRAANFTNEIGVDGTVRYLRNVMGLWVLSECLREWQVHGRPVELGPLLEAAGDLPAGGPLVNIDDPSLLAPGPMVTRLARLCRATDQRAPDAPPDVVRCVLDSLAAAFARAVTDATQLAGRRVGVVHLVGGGARNALLCQLTADACGLPVVAGPVEATALGNILVQARTAGVLHGGLADLRELVRSTQSLQTYQPASQGVSR